MRGSKVKMLRRIYWTEKANGRHTVMRSIKRMWGKGVPLGPTITYPRKGRDWRKLVA